MAAHLYVVNEALSKLGASPIASMSDAGAQATAARALFRTTYTRLLAESPWNWALNKVRLRKPAIVDYHALGRFSPGTVPHNLRPPVGGNPLVLGAEQS